MRLIAGTLLALILTVYPAYVQPLKAKHSGAKAGEPAAGVRAPGVQIPFGLLKPEIAYEAGGKIDWIAVAADTVWLPGAAEDSLDRIDPKSQEKKLLESVAGVKQPCGGAVSAFSHVWAPTCGEGAVFKIDPKSGKVEGKLAFGAAPVRGSIAASADSIWLLTDSKTTLSRIDPVQGGVVAELRVPAACAGLLFAENSLWLACPDEDKVLRINAMTNLVDKSIAVSAGPVSLAFGEGSVWALCRKAGKLERIDPKTDKVTKTIDLNAPGDGTVSVGEGSVWVSVPRFPVTRVDPQTDKVVQQFWGEGGTVIQAAGGAVWLAMPAQNAVWKIDPRRIAATLAE